MQARRTALLAVLLISQAVAVVPVIVAVLLTDHAPPDATAWFWSGVAGLAGTIGIGAFYRGLAVGTMSIVAPIASTGAALPVIVGLAEGERPSAVQAIGIIVAIVGVMLAGREPDDPARTTEGSRAALGLALLAALGIGMTFVGLDQATETAGVAWSLLGQRALEVTLFAVAVLVTRPTLPRERTTLGALALLGVLDMSAQAMFAVATTKGLLSIVSVLSSLYPATTVLLARTVLHERVSRLQEAGVVAILAGVVAISAG